VQIPRSASRITAGLAALCLFPLQANCDEPPKVPVPVDSVDVAGPAPAAWSGASAPTLGERILAAILDAWFTLRDLCFLVVIPIRIVEFIFPDDPRQYSFIFPDRPSQSYGKNRDNYFASCFFLLSIYYGIAMIKSWEDRNYTSLGKTKMGLKVVNHADGKRISDNQAIFRPFAYVFI
jgi:hypothetical protein